MKVVFAEVERVIRSSVEVDVDQFCAAEAFDRAKFDGSDVEYVQHRITNEATEWLDSEPTDADLGVRVTQEWDETEATILSPSQGSSSQPKGAE